MEEYIMKSTIFQWFDEIFNMAILSRINPEQKNIFKMFESFSYIIWILIFLTTFSLVIYQYFYRQIKGIIFKIPRWKLFLILV